MKAYDFECLEFRVVKLMPTFCIAAGGDFENLLPSGNGDLQRYYNIFEKAFKTIPAPNQS